MAKTTSCVVYWLHDQFGVCWWRHGYIGVTQAWPRRFYRHRSESKFLPNHFEGEIIFKGSIKQCLALEQQLRPVAGIGWNRFPGGLSGYAAKGIPKSPEQREKMRAAALRRYSDPAERERTQAAVKEALKGIDRSGAANSMYGKHQSEAAKQKIRTKIAERGGFTGANNPNYRHGRYTES